MDRHEFEKELVLIYHLIVDESVKAYTENTSHSTEELKSHELLRNFIDKWAPNE